MVPREITIKTDIRGVLRMHARTTYSVHTVCYIEKQGLGYVSTFTARPRDCKPSDLNSAFATMLYSHGGTPYSVHMYEVLSLQSVCTYVHTTQGVLQWSQVM